jgi:sugar fermentation stimulation protein A
MQFESTLLEGRFLKRYKRFFLDAELPDGSVITAHSVNTGNLYGVQNVGARVWLSRASNPNRKLAYTWEAVEVDGTMVGINTSRTNKLAEEALIRGLFPCFPASGLIVRREVKYGQNSRVDFLVSTPDGKDCYLEVKNVHMRRTGTLAEFPDSVTERGAKHMYELAECVKAGHRAMVMFIVQRSDVRQFRAAADIDPAYDAALRYAASGGVEVYAHACEVSPEAIAVSHPLEVLL